MIIWNKETDTFTFDRQTLADIMDFLDFIDMTDKKDQPTGWAEWKDTFIAINKSITEYAKDLKP